MASRGALMIPLYSEEPRFHHCHQILISLMDIDSLITKWRYITAHLVQRMLGSARSAQGGSSGYQYLRSTLHREVQGILDLYHYLSFLIPDNLFRLYSTQIRLH